VKYLRAEWVIVAFIILASIGVRSYRITMPILEGCVARQINSADFARNMYRDGEFLKPKLSQFERPFFISECPIYCYSVSLVYRMVGNSEEAWGRIVTICAFAIGMIALYLIAKSYASQEIALLSICVLSLLPIGIIYGKSFQPDQLSVTFGVLSIYSMMRWTKNEKIINFIISSALLIIASLTKLTTLSLLLTTLAIIVLKKRKRSFFYCASHVVLVVAGIAPWLMYMYNYNNVIVKKEIADLVFLYNKAGLVTPYITSAFSLDTWISFERLFSYTYYKEMFVLLSGEVLTSIGFPLLVLGLVLKNKKSEEVILYVWLMSSFAPFILLSKKFGPHWFLLPLPVLAFFIGKALYGMKSILPSITSHIYYRGILVGVVLFCVWGYANSGFLIPQGVANMVPISELVKEKTERNDFICTDASRYLIYYSDRKGYLIWQAKEADGRRGNSEDIFIKEVKRLKGKGVNYLIITKIERFNSHPFLKDYIESNYTLAGKVKGVCLLYKL